MEKKESDDNLFVYKDILNKRINWIDLLKCLAIIFVVIYHSGNLSCDIMTETAGIEEYINYFSRTILSTCVPIFFFINGYLFFSKEFNYSLHIKKMLRYVALAVVWGCITLFVLQFIKGEFLTGQQFVSYLYNWQHGWIHHLWFLGALVCLYVFAPLLKVVYDTNIKVFFMFLGICAILTFGNVFLEQGASILLWLLRDSNYLIEKNYFTIFNPFRGWPGYSVVYFCLGGVVYHYKNKIEGINVSSRNKISVCVLIISCVIWFGLGLLFSHITGSTYDVVWNGYATIFTLVNVICLYLLSLNLKKR